MPAPRRPARRRSLSILAATAWVLGASILLAGCGGGGSPSSSTPAASAPTAAPADSLPAGVVLQFVSGETGAPVGPATVTVAGRTYSSPGGSVTLAERVPLSAELDVVVPDMLERRTLIRDAATMRFSLWPSRSPTGLDDGFTQSIVYSRTSGTSPLRRLARGTTRVAVVPSADIRADGEAMAAHQDAIDRLNAAAGGEVVYALAAERPATGAYVETRMDASDSTCTGANILAFEQDFTRGGETVRSVIVFCDYRVARTPTVTHEMGHTFGLSHSPDKGEVMYAYYNGHGGVDFSAREALAMKLMMQRRGGNVFPDDDRTVTGSTALQVHLTACGPGAR